MQFGNIFNRKKNIMARLNGIQRALSIRPSSFLINLENELLKDLDVVLNQEEEIWALKSWVNWLVQGNRNIAFLPCVYFGEKEKESDFGNQGFSLRVDL